MLMTKRFDYLWDCRSFTSQLDISVEKRRKREEEKKDVIKRRGRCVGKERLEEC